MCPPAAPAYSNSSFLLKFKIFGWTTEILESLFNKSISGLIQFLETSMSEFTIKKYLWDSFFKPWLYPPAKPWFLSSLIIVISGYWLSTNLMELSWEKLSIKTISASDAEYLMKVGKNFFNHFSPL